LSCGNQKDGQTLYNTPANKETPLKTSTSLRYATPVGNNEVQVEEEGEVFEWLRFIVRQLTDEPLTTAAK